MIGELDQVKKIKRIRIAIIGVIVAIGLIAVFSPIVKFQIEKKEIKSAKKADIVTYGNYDWKVLAVKEQKVLLVCNEFVEIKKFDESGKKVTWEDSTIRKWLNSDFYEKKFTAYEKKAIVVSEIKNQALRFGETMELKKSETVELPNTKDRVFLLSREEVQQYINPEGERKTPMNVNETKDSWYTRTTVLGESWVITQPDENECTFNLEAGIRPAIWIDKTLF